MATPAVLNMYKFHQHGLFKSVLTKLRTQTVSDRQLIGYGWRNQSSVLIYEAGKKKIKLRDTERARHTTHIHTQTHTHARTHAGRESPRKLPSAQGMLRNSLRGGEGRGGRGHVTSRNVDTKTHTNLLHTQACTYKHSI